jgi:hypothetical protein
LLNRPSVRALSVAIVATATVLAGCNTDSITPTARPRGPLFVKMLAEISGKKYGQGSSVLARMSEMEI